MADETMNVKETTKPKVSSSKKLTDVLPVRPTSDAKKQTAIGTGIVVGLLSGLVGAPLLAMGAIGVGAGAAVWYGSGMILKQGKDVVKKV
jgi:hypothetical protein